LRHPDEIQTWPDEDSWTSALKKSSPGHDLRHPDEIQTWPDEDSWTSALKKSLPGHD
jgi:hypothetical protein